jgi:hypothetical protein
MKSSKACATACGSLFAIVVMALASQLTNAAPAQATVAAGASGYARIQPACQPPQPAHASCFALIRQAVPATEAGRPGVRRFTAPGRGSSSATAGPAGGLTPADLAGAYNYAPTATGTGQTVAIVDAFDDPKIEQDLKEFDSHYELAECTTANGCFKKVGQTGETTSLPEADKTAWSVEISLDVEAVHAACPNCKILLVEANSTSFVDLAAAVDEAVALGANEVSNSYGGYEESWAAEVEPDYHHPGVVIAAATGDRGWSSWAAANEGFAPSSPAAPNIPSSLPDVVAVGGTTLELAGEKRASETVWNGNGPLNTSPFIEGATGGGCSLVFTAPLWQQDAAGFGATGCGTKRSTGDVAAVADPLTGFDIFDTYNCGPSCAGVKGWLTIGGTSLSTPLISAMYALAGGPAGVGFPALTLYGHFKDASAISDVTKGGNGYCDDEGKACGINAELAEEGLGRFRFDCEGTTSCNATSGFDGPSGVGAPASLSLFKPLLPTAVITLPAKLVTGVPLAFGAAGSTDPYPGGTTGASYSWTFGDGGSGSGLTPSHTYSSPGKFAVTLTVTDGYGFKSGPKTTELTVTEHTAKETKEEEEAAKHKAEEEAAKHKAEEEAGRKAGEEAAKKVAEEVAARARAAEEAARTAAETHSTGSTGIASFTVTNPDATLASSSLLAPANGSFTVKIACPAGETSCEGTVTVQTAGAVVASAKAHVLTMATGTFKVAGGKVATIKLHLSRKARSLLARKHTLRVRVTIASHDPSGSSHTSRALATLRASGKHH